jgi:endonuclease YncB( thermonuclease family)
MLMIRISFFVALILIASSIVAVTITVEGLFLEHVQHNQFTAAAASAVATTTTTTTATTANGFPIISYDSNQYKKYHHHLTDGILLLSLVDHHNNNVIVADADNSNNHRFMMMTSTTTTTLASNSNSNIKYSNDKVERIVDANTIQLKKMGTVRLSDVRMPSVSSGSAFQFSSCYNKSPSYKIRQLLPKKTSVRVAVTNSNNNNNNNNIPQVVIIRNNDSLIINEELVKTGYAIVKKTQSSSSSSSSSVSVSQQQRHLLDLESLTALQEQAQTQGIGIFTECESENNNDSTTPSSDSSSSSSFTAIFEPLERSVETIYGIDGGKQQIRDETILINNQKLSINPKNNPGGIIKGCSDFNTYEQALKWYEYYYKYYGYDVAKLDRNNDGIPCPGLSHTTSQEKYRMKVPTINKIK